MSDIDTRQLIGAALAGCRHTSWVAALSDGEGGIVQIIWENPADSEALEAIVRAEHGMRIHDAGRVFVARARAELGRYAYGATLGCGGKIGWRLLVTVLRGEAFGRFTEADLGVLAEAASTIATSTMPSFKAAAARGHANVRLRDQPAFFVLNTEYEVELSWVPENMRHLEGLWPGPSRLSAVVEGAVRELIADWNLDDPATLRPAVAVPKPTIVVRVIPLNGRDGPRLGVTIEPLKTRDTIGVAAREFSLSPRELDVLALLLEGRETPEVARMLHIAASTATDHVKRMLVKTNSRNRSELIARALGWQSGRRQ